MDSTSNKNFDPFVFVESLVDQMLKGREFRASYHATTEDLDHPPYSIFDCLDINRELLSPTASEALNVLESGCLEAEREWSAFKWKLAAFLHIQDIFDAPLYDQADPSALFSQYYFYYESRNVLSESFLCGLNGYTIGASALLRVFIEFSLLQTYFYRLINKSRSYRCLDQYFVKSFNPSWNTVLRRALPNDDFSNTVRFRIQSHLDGLSESTLHPYHPDHSPVQHKRPNSSHSLESLYFWTLTNVTLESVLWQRGLRKFGQCGKW